MRTPILLSIAIVALLAGCDGPAGSGLVLADGSDARVWGDGPYGVVLVPDAGRDADSWDATARTFADDGMTVLAVDGADPDGVVAALRHLRASLDRVALLGAGAGADAALAVAAREPDLVDQLIVLSARADVSGLADFPKLFVASEQEAAAADAERMAAEAAGEWNDLYLAAGDATGQAILDGEGADGAMEAIGRRLDERR